MIQMILSIVSAVFAAAVLVYAVHLSVVYHRFNEGIQRWGESLDNSMVDSVNRAARNILRELDARITEQKNNEENKEENEEC